MGDDEHSESEFYYPDELVFDGKNERASINYKRVGAEEGEGNNASQEEIETFIQEKKSENTDVCPLILENIDEISHILWL